MAEHLTGNKGEWSEAYVLLKLLSQGRIYAADEKLHRINDMYFPIIKILREEARDRRCQYAVDSPDGEGKIEVYFNDELKKTIMQSEFETEAAFLYSKIVAGGNHAFAIERTEDFLSSIYCSRLAAPSTDKTDIKMEIHDINTGYQSVCGFSIKSEIGSAPTLINATGATNFIYEISGLTESQISEINEINTNTKIKDRMDKIFSLSTGHRFVKIASETFEHNLMLIDSRMNELLAEALLCHYRDGIIKCKDVVDSLESNNPLLFPVDGFYSYKFKEFLCAAALGMTPATPWDGKDDANGGYIVVTTDGSVLAYHIYNRDSFKQYLLNNTKYERASTSRHGYAFLYTENGKTYLKLNLQIRFL